MWCRGRTGVLINLEQCQTIYVEEAQHEGKPILRLVAALDSSTKITLETMEMETMSPEEAAHEIEIVREQLFRAISNGARFFRIE